MVTFDVIRAFLIDRQGVRSKVSGTSEAFLGVYQKLIKDGKEVYAEIEYSFLSKDGVPFHPRLRRVGTLDDLSTT